VLLGVDSKTEGAPLGKAMLFGLLLERLKRRNWDEKEKRRFFLSSIGRSFSSPFVVAERLNLFSDVCFSSVAGIRVEARDLLVVNSGSSEASREEGVESVRRLEGACITHHISTEH
jgi:hypothetical protein